MAASHPKVGKALFEMGVTSSCEFEKHQYFTTHLHIAPEDELIYLGGLPPVSTTAHDCLCSRLFVHTTVCVLAHDCLSLHTAQFAAVRAARLFSWHTTALAWLL